MKKQTAEPARSLIYGVYQRATAYRLAFAREHRLDFDVLEMELPNLYATIDWCMAQEQWDLLVQFTRALHEFWMRTGHWHDCLKYSRYVLLSDILESDGEKAEVMGQVAFLEQQLGNYAEARHMYEQQLGHLRQAGKADAASRTLKQLKDLALKQDDDKAAQRFLEELVASTRNVKDHVDTLCDLAALHHRQEDLHKANLLCQEGLKIALSIGYTVGLVNILKQQASIRFSQRNCRDARELYRAALDVASKIGDRNQANKIRRQLAILEAAMQKYVFISYNHHDRSFAERLACDLSGAGFAVWWAEWEIKVGDSIIEKVSQGIERSAHLAVVLSPHSVRSNWVKRELGSALMKQLSVERDITVLPLLLVDCEIPVLLREIKYADFRKDYETGFQEILSALLKAGAD